MKNLNKRGMVSLEILAIILIPGALTAFLAYKIASKVPVIKRYAPQNLQLQK